VGQYIYIRPSGRGAGRAPGRARGHDYGRAAGTDRGGQGGDRGEGTPARGCTIAEGGGEGEGRCEAALAAEPVKCGKPGCRKDREGAGHGPYWYLYYTNEKTAAGTRAATRASSSGRSWPRSSGPRRALRRCARTPRARTQRIGTGTRRSQSQGDAPSSHLVAASAQSAHAAPRRSDPLRPITRHGGRR
jgi:hypothetical protein